MKLRTRLALGMSGFMLIVLLASFGSAWLVARYQLVEARYDVLRQAFAFLEEDPRNQGAVMALYNDSLLLQRDEQNVWRIVAGQAVNVPDFALNYGEPERVGDWFVIATENGFGYAFRDPSVSETLDLLLFILGVVFLIAIVVTYAGSFWTARQGLLPLARLERLMSRISESGQLEHVDITGKDEVGSLARVFNAMISRVELSLTKQRQFVADVSHELKTPLTVIEGYARLLRRWGKEDPEVQDEAVEHILEETRRMREDLIEPMLELSRFQSLEEVEAETFDVGELAADVSARFLHSHGVNVPVIASGSWFGHKESLHRILVILVDNSLKYAGETEIYGDESVIEVRDRGPVLADVDREKLFDRFYRLDEARDRSGSGLGLAIAKEVAVLNGWTVGSRANEPDGSIFFVKRT